MAGERTFVVKILGDAGSAVAAFKKLQGEGEKVTGALGTQSKQLEGIFKQVTIAAAAGFAGGVALITSSINAARQAQAEQTRLATLLRNTVGASDEQIASLNLQAEALQKVGVVSAGTTSVVQSQLATFDLSVDTIRRLTPAVLDYVTAEKGAAASTEEFKSMTNGLAQALQGNFASLTKSGFVLDANTKELIKNGTESERAAALVGVLNSTYEGFNQTLRDTPEGQFQSLNNSFNDLKTSLGQLLLPALAAVLPLFQALATLAQENSTLFGVLVITFTAVAGAALLYATYLKLLPLRIAAVATAQAILNFLMTANPFGLMVVGVAALTVGFVALVGGMDNLIRSSKEMLNGFNRLVNIFLPDMLEIPMLKVAKATTEITQQNHRAIPIAEQIGTKYLEIAGACIEILKVPLAKQLATQTDRLTQLAFSLGVTSVSYGKFDKGLGGVSKTVETAAEKLKKYTDALDKSQVAEKTLTRATKDRGRAQQSLDVAKTGVLAAQKAFNDAVNGFGADSLQARNAQRELAKAERSVEQAGYRVEESLFAVTDAEKRLADLRKDPATSAQAIREAEISLAQAKLAVAEASESQFEATNGLAVAQLALNEAVDGAVEGSKTYNDLQLEVIKAKQLEEQASETLADAVDREAKSYRDLADAIKEANVAARTAKVTSTAPLLPPVPTPGGGGAVGVPGDVRGGPTVNVYPGIGTDGPRAAREIAGLLKDLAKIDPNSVRGFAGV